MAERSPSWPVLSKTVRAMFYSFNLLFFLPAIDRTSQNICWAFDIGSQSVSIQTPLLTPATKLEAQADSSGRWKDRPWGRSSGQHPPTPLNPQPPHPHPPKPPCGRSFFTRRGWQYHCHPTCLAFSWLNSNCASPSRIPFGSDWLMQLVLLPERPGLDCSLMPAESQWRLPQTHWLTTLVKKTEELHATCSHYKWIIKLNK